MADINIIIARVRERLDDYDRDAADAEEQGEIWPHDPGTEIDLPVGWLRALLDKIARQAVEIVGTRADAWSERTDRIAAEAELARQAAALTAAVHEVSATGRALGEEQGRHDATKASLREAVEVMRNVRASYLQNDDHTAWCRAIPVLDDFIAKMENPERDNSASDMRDNGGNIPSGNTEKPHE